ncbi:MAG: hypothetical protein ACRCVT_11835, partial [Leadbetterella sp.]
TGMVEKDPVDESAIKITFRIEAETDIPITIKALRARGKIYAGSFVEFLFETDDANGDQFFPSGSFSGEFSPATKVLGTKQEIEATPIDGEGSAQFTGLKFVNLNFQTKERPYVTVEDFSYVRDESEESARNRFGRFPISISKLSKVKGPLWNGSAPTENDLWIDFGFDISLAKGKLMAGSEMVIKTFYRNGRLKFDGIALKEAYVNGSFSALDNMAISVFAKQHKIKVLKES